MRGIAGIVHLDQRPAPLGDLHRITQAMAVSPDIRVTPVNEGPVAFAHLLKQFTLEDRTEAQPLRSSNDDFLLVTDALLDNREELADALGWRADELGKCPDSALVLAALERWGDAAPTQLGGRFALAVWHRREQRLFCAVDVHGSRPLYYWRGPHAVAFASTLRGMFAFSQVSRRLDEEMFADFVVGMRHSPDGRTLYRDISWLPGGHTLQVDARGARIQRYWTPDAHRVLALGSDADYAAAFLAEFTAAVRRSLQRAPGNVGVLVSGGLDSSAITAIAGKLLGAQGRRLQAIHRVPRPGSRYTARHRELDESSYVRALRDHAPQVDFHFTESADAPLSIPEWDDYFEVNCVPHRGLPSKGDSAYRALLSKLDISVLLDGQGGNFLVSPEALNGRYLESLFFSGHAWAWWQAVRGQAHVYGHSPRWLIRQTAVNPLDRLMRTPEPRGDSWLLTPALRARVGVDSPTREDDWQRPVRDYRRYLHRLLTETMAQLKGMAPAVMGRQTSLTLGRAPMFDRRFNEFCLALPFAQQFRDGWDRRLLRETMRGLLPDVVRLRLTRGFPQPAFQQHFAHTEPALRAELDRLAECPAVREWLDLDALRLRWDSRPPVATWGRELALVRGVTAGCFLRWHARQT